jgi:hypothetical protein
METCRSISRRVGDIVGNSFFSGVVTLLLAREMLLYVDCVRYVSSRTIRGLSVGCVWHVGRVSPCRVYINLNRRDSRI